MNEAYLMLVKSLKGAPGSCLRLLEGARREGIALSQGYLERWSGYSDKPVRQALKFLEELGLAVETSRNRWELGEKWLLVSAGETCAEPAAGPVPKNARRRHAKKSGDSPACLESSLESGLESGSGGTPLKNLDRDLPPPDSRPGSRRRANSGSPGARGHPPAGKPNPRVEENLAECDAQGINEPARSQISRRLKVTPELIRHHCQNAPSLGAAIWRLQHGWREKTGAEQAGNRYISGQYANFIQH
jgi:hypothetical protein